MASGLDTTVIANVMDALNHNTTFSAPGGSTNNLPQMTVEGSSTSNGTELATSGGYTAGGNNITMGAAAAYTSGHRVASNTTTVTITNMPATTISDVELWDRGGSPARKWWGDLAAAVTTNSGDTLTYATGSVTQTVTARVAPGVRLGCSLQQPRRRHERHHRHHREQRRHVRKQVEQHDHFGWRSRCPAGGRVHAVGGEAVDRVDAGR